MLSFLFTLLIYVNTISFGHATSCPQHCSCNQDVTVVYCYGGGLNTTQFYQILEVINPEALELDIQAPNGKPNNFKWNDNLNRFTKLQYLTLINCGIPALSQRIRLPALKELNLRYNKIDTLQIDSFSGMSKLLTLDLSYNKITVIPSGCFVYLKSLTSISLSHNYFPELPSNFLFNPRKLLELQIDGSKLPVKQINDILNNVPNLKRLELNFCSLNDVKFSTIELKKVPKLERLGIGGNALTFVPSSRLRDLPELEIIDLSHNQIRQLQPCAFCSCNISTVILHNNLLGIDDNALHIETFAHVDVKDLDLSFNFFDQFESKLLGRAQHSIEKLHLSGNTITSIRESLINTLPKLTELHLSSNHLNEFPNSWPIEFSTLHFLNISNNHIKEVSVHFKKWFPFLKVVDLSNNLISYLDAELTSYFIDETELVYLNNNPWNCRCASQGVQRYFSKRPVRLPSSEQVLCAQPAEVKGLPVYKVQKINDCALLFGGQYQLTQLTELAILILIICCIAIFIAFLFIGILCLNKRNLKKQKLARNGPGLHHIFDSTTMALRRDSHGFKDGFEDNEDLPLPPPLPPITSFGS